MDLLQQCQWPLPHFDRVHVDFPGFSERTVTAVPTAYMWIKNTRDLRETLHNRVSSLILVFGTLRTTFFAAV